MEKKKGSLSTVFLVIAIILIVIMGALLYMQKTEADRQIAELENNASKLQETINDLQGKIDSVSNIVNDNTTIKIEGEYHLVQNENSEGLTYKFEGNKVTFSALYVTKGTYEIEDNKIKITYSEAYDVDGNSMEYPNGKYEELTIVDEKTLTSQTIRDGVVYTGKYVKNITSSENNLNNTNSTQYIEMTEATYKKYNTLPNYFRIQEMIDNKNGTITIRGRVYQETELLKITKEQYGKLLEGKVIDLLGYQMKVNKEEDPSNGGYDMLITSTTAEKWMKFYVEKNSDGSGKLHYYTEDEMYRGTPFQKDETGRFIGTNTYLQITLDDKLKCESGNASTTLREEFNKSNGILNINKNDDIKLPYLNDEFNFENGKCVSIRFSGV